MKLFYEELADWWPLISPVSDYAGEAQEILRILRERRPAARTLLELGSGGGHVAFYVKRDFDCVLSDQSTAMLEQSRRLNPECVHVAGDMRGLALEREFDVVLAHDAIGYMITEGDLRRVFDTAWRHLRPGGLALFIPDDVTETFAPGTDVSGSDGPDGRAARLFEWVEAVAPTDTTATVHYAFLLRDASGSVRSLYERHVVGLFSRACWERLLIERGFAVEVAVERTDEERPPRLLFLGHKPERSD